MPRRGATVILVSLSLLPFGISEAAAAPSPKPRSVSPTIKLLSTTESGGFSLQVSFPADGAACLGKVMLAAGKGAHFSAPLKAKGRLCEATLKGALPVSDLGTKVPFTASFKGDKAIKPFSRTQKLKLGTAPPPAPPPASPTPVPSPTSPPVIEPTHAFDGRWVGTLDGGGDEIELGVQSGIIQAGTSTQFNLPCNSPEGTVVSYDYDYGATLPLSENLFAGEWERTTSGQQMKLSLSGEFASATTAKVLISATGEIDFGSEFVEDCHYTNTATLGKLP